MSGAGRWRSLERMLIDGASAGVIDEGEARRGLDEARRLRAAEDLPGDRDRSLARLLASLGTTAIVAAVMWFFASNWQGLHRYAKLGLILSAVLGAYGSGGFLYHRRPEHRFAGRVLIFVGVLFFGLALALIGQVYNSHADAYTLFLVWLVPALAFLWRYRFPSLAILSVLLANLALYFLLYPSGDLRGAEPEHLLGFLAIDLTIVAVGERAALRAAIGRAPFILAWMASLSALFFLTFYAVTEVACAVYNAAFLGLLASGFYYFIERRLDKPMVGVALLAACIYVFAKFIEISAYHFDAWVFVFGLIFGLALIGGEVLFVRMINAWIARREQALAPKGLKGEQG